MQASMPAPASPPRGAPAGHPRARALERLGSARSRGPSSPPHSSCGTPRRGRPRRPDACRREARSQVSAPQPPASRKTRRPGPSPGYPVLVPDFRAALPRRERPRPVDAHVNGKSALSANRTQRRVDGHQDDRLGWRGHRGQPLRRRRLHALTRPGRWCTRGSFIRAASRCERAPAQCCWSAASRGLMHLTAYASRCILRKCRRSSKATTNGTTQRSAQPLPTWIER